MRIQITRNFQKFKQNDSKTSYSSNYCTNFREKQVKEKEKKEESVCNLSLKEEKT